MLLVDKRSIAIKSVLYVCEEDQKRMSQSGLLPFELNNLSDTLTTDTGNVSLTMKFVVQEL